VTASWHQDEYAAVGVPYAERGAVLDETIAACRALWTSAPASFHGRFVNFDGMFCSPRPAPGERIPVWFGGKFTPRQIRRIVELGDGWMPFGGHRMTVDEKAEAIATLRSRYLAAGRDPASLEVCDPLPRLDSLEASMEQIPPLAEAGVTMFRVHLGRFAETPDRIMPTLAEIVRRFQAFRSLAVGSP